MNIQSWIGLRWCQDPFMTHLRNTHTWCNTSTLCEVTTIYQCLPGDGCDLISRKQEVYLRNISCSFSSESQVVSHMSESCESLMTSHSLTRLNHTGYTGWYDMWRFLFWSGSGDWLTGATPPHQRFILWNKNKLPLQKTSENFRIKPPSLLPLRWILLLYVWNKHKAAAPVQVTGQINVRPVTNHRFKMRVSISFILALCVSAKTYRKCHYYI